MIIAFIVIGYVLNSDLDNLYKIILIGGILIEILYDFFQCRNERHQREAIDFGIMSGNLQNHERIKRLEDQFLKEKK